MPEDKWCTCDPKYEVDGKPYPPVAKINLGESANRTFTVNFDDVVVDAFPG